VSRAARDIAVVKYLLDIMAMELQRTKNHNLLLLKDAQQRIVDFLLEMKNRQQGQNEIDLPMTRLDIADYLGLSIETVSRVLTRLKRASAISLPTFRRVILRDLSVLN
jgi:CRP/FNR family nitrogen fixation transcriptional regulator